MSYVICEQQRRRSACASAQSDKRLCCLLLRWYNISRFCSRNFKTLASFCGCAGRFVSGLVGNSRRHVLSFRSPYEWGGFLDSRPLHSEIVIIDIHYGMRINSSCIRNYIWKLNDPARALWDCRNVVSV